MNPGRVNIELKAKIRRKNREAASARCSGRFGEYKGTEYQHDKKNPVDKRKLYENKQLNNSTSDDQVQALMDKAPWWFTAFKNVFKIIPELGQLHSSSILDRLTHQGDPSVLVDLFLVRPSVIKERPVGIEDSSKDQQLAYSPTGDMVGDPSQGRTSKSYDFPQAIYSHVIRLTNRRPGRTREGGPRGGEGGKLKETIVQSINTNPVLHFTLEEEFKVIDMIVRMEDYTVRYFAFKEKNFGSNCFPGYSQLTTEKAVCTNFAGKLPYNPAVEQRLFNLGYKFTYMNFDIFFNEMGHLDTRVKMKMMKNSFPAGLMILYAILEYNNLEQPPGLMASWQPQGQDKVRQIRMADLERFTSPWALDYADEVNFYTTIRKVGEVLGRDLQLQALYTILVMITPWQNQV